MNETKKNIIEEIKKDGHLVLANTYQFKKYDKNLPRSHRFLNLQKALYSVNRYMKHKENLKRYLLLNKKIKKLEKVYEDIKIEINELESDKGNYCTSIKRKKGIKKIFMGIFWRCKYVRHRIYGEIKNEQKNNKTIFRNNVGFAETS